MLVGSHKFFGTLLPLRNNLLITNSRVLRSNEMISIKGLVCKEAGSDLEPFTYELPAELAENEVEIRVSHCGLCGSDLHMIKDDWMMSEFPFVPGHEVVGEVSAVGAGVKGLKIGQRVGVGWQCSSCQNCDDCKQGNEQFCRKGDLTIVGRNGGFAEKLRVDSNFAFAIPDAIPSELAAPLLCAGHTVYSAIKHFGVKPKDPVAVVGLGGLGHLAVQFLSSMGCEVTVISRGTAKEAEAKSFGAAKYIDSTNAPAMRVYNAFSFIFTSSLNSDDLTRYVNMLKADGTLVTFDSGSVVTFPLGILSNRKKLASTITGSRQDMVDMFDFALKHNIKPKIELLPLEKANEALKKLQNNEVRYRIVFKV